MTIPAADALPVLLTGYRLTSTMGTTRLLALSLLLQMLDARLLVGKTLVRFMACPIEQTYYQPPVSPSQAPSWCAPKWGAHALQRLAVKGSRRGGIETTNLPVLGRWAKQWPNACARPWGQKSLQSWWGGPWGSTMMESIWPREGLPRCGASSRRGWGGAASREGCGIKHQDSRTRGRGCLCLCEVSGY